MPEKLLTLKEVSDMLGVSEEDVKKLTEKGVMPAYKVGGQFLRYRKEQVGIIRNEIKSASLPREEPARAAKRKADKTYDESFQDRILDFFYFNDFYILSTVLIFTIVYIIFKS